MAPRQGPQLRLAHVPVLMLAISCLSLASPIATSPGQIVQIHGLDEMQADSRLAPLVKRDPAPMDEPSDHPERLTNIAKSSPGSEDSVASFSSSTQASAGALHKRGNTDSKMSAEEEDSSLLEFERLWRQGNLDPGIIWNPVKKWQPKNQVAYVFLTGMLSKYAPKKYKEKARELGIPIQRSFFSLKAEPAPPKAPAMKGAPQVHRGAVARPPTRGRPVQAKVQPYRPPPSTGKE